jgi:serine/threonine protein kinase
METLHDLGFVYNDLKPDNILIGDDSIKQYISQKAKGFEESDMANHKLRLIDFGLASRYLDNEGNHIAEGGQTKFKGSMLFASSTAFKFMETSRRDDLISLVYLLVFLLDLSRLSFINDVEDVSKSRQFEIIKNFKIKAGSKELCGTQEENSLTFFLTKFVDAVMGLQYHEKPPYERLRQLLLEPFGRSPPLPNSLHQFS